jgi:hypothetical protein
MNIFKNSFILHRILFVKYVLCMSMINIKLLFVKIVYFAKIVTSAERPTSVSDSVSFKHRNKSLSKTATTSIKFYQQEHEVNIRPPPKRTSRGKILSGRWALANWTIIIF